LAIASADTLNFFYKEDLDQKKSIREIIQELRDSQTLNEKQD